jgi:hypothetical protein
MSASRRRAGGAARGRRTAAAQEHQLGWVTPCLRNAWLSGSARSTLPSIGDQVARLERAGLAACWRADPALLPAGRWQASQAPRSRNHEHSRHPFRLPRPSGRAGRDREAVPAHGQRREVARHATALPTCRSPTMRLLSPRVQTARSGGRGARHPRPRCRSPRRCASPRAHVITAAKERVRHSRPPGRGLLLCRYERPRGLLRIS